VSAYDARANESAKSTAAVVTTLDTIAPSAPTNLGTTVISQTQINLAWTASTDNVGVTGYKVFRGGVQIGTSATTSYSDTTCQSYTTYSYTVSAYDAAGNNSALSNSAQGTTTPYTDIVVDNPAATYVGSWFLGTSATDKYGADYNYCTTAATETKTATWTPKIDIAGYYTVYCWYPQGANRSTIAPFTVVFNGGQQTVNVNQTSGGGQWITLVTNKKFAAGTAGYIKLGNGTNEASLSVMADAIRVLLVSSDLTAPSVPTNLAATAASATSVNLTWTASTDNVGVTGYRVFRNGAAVGTSATASYTDTGLTQLTTYTYTVTAYDAMGNESAQSSSANATTWDGTPPSVPAGLSATAITPTRVSLSWTASTDNIGVTGYKVYRGGVYVTTVTTLTYVDTGRSPSTAYSYTVSAIDARSNESAQSTAANATTPAFAEIIIDNPAATITGVWATLTTGAKYGADFIYASTAVTEGKTATWRPTISYAGNYNVYVWYTVGSNRATNSPYYTVWDGGNATVNVNQTVSGGQWVLLQSNRHFAAGTAGYVKLGNGTGATGKIVVADAVRFVQASGD
jgi:chitodextrinase